jgi:hypothetical protein
MMNRAFRFTNGLRRSPRENIQQQEDGIQNKICSLESWQMADGGQGPQCGPTGPHRDLTFRRSPTGEQENFPADDGTLGGATLLTFGNTGGPPGPGSKPITQETSPKQGPGKQGGNRAPAATMGTTTMWAQAPDQQGVHQAVSSQLMGMKLDQQERECLWEHTTHQTPTQRI